MVCPTAFRPDQVRASFVRCFASLLYTYRKYLVSATGERKKAGMLYEFRMDEFMKSMPNENAQYMAMMQQTQGMFSPRCPARHMLNLIKGSTNSSTNEKPPVQTTQPLDSSMRSSWQNAIAEGHRSSTNRGLISYPIPRIIFGVQLPQILQIHDSQATIDRLSVGVS